MKYKLTYLKETQSMTEQFQEDLFPLCASKPHQGGHHQLADQIAI